MKNINQYTKTGEFHRKNRQECQDVVYYRENEDCKMIALADGASYCKNGKRGAAIACEAAMDFYMESGDDLEKFQEGKAAALVMEQIRYRLQKEAARENNDLDSYASTLAFVFYHKKKNSLTIFNLGDGGVFWTDEGQQCHSMLTAPGQAHYNTLSKPWTGNYEAVLKRKKVSGMESIWLCSDGVLNEMKKWQTEESLKKDMAKMDYGDINKRLCESGSEDDLSYITMRIQ